MLFVKKKRIEAMESEIKALRGQMDMLLSERGALSEHMERKRGQRASLTQTVNEWIWGKEEGDENGT